MCLYIGNKNGFVTKEEITVYKALSKSGRGYKTPSQGYPAKVGQDLVPSNPEPSISKCGFKFSLDGGAIHTFLNPVKALENYSGCEIFKATIPAGTHIWIQDDLGQIAASRVYISKDTITKADKALYQRSLKPLHDQLLKTAEVRLADGRDVILSPVQARKGDKVIGIKVAGHVVSTQYFEALEFCHNSRTISTTKPMSWDEAEEDKNGEENQKNILANNPDYSFPAIEAAKNVGGYLPAIKELKDVFSQFLELNLTRTALGLDPMPFAWYWSSSVRDNTSVWGLDSDGYWYCWYYCGCLGYRGHVLPFFSSCEEG